MNPEQQPTPTPSPQPIQPIPPMQPVQPIQPMGQPASSFQPVQPTAPQPFAPAPPPRSSKKVIGIIIAVIVVMLLGTGALLYFIWWQNPQKVAADAVMSVLTAQKMTSDGSVTISADEMTLVSDITLKNDGENGAVDIKIKLKLPEVPELTVTVRTVTAQDGTLYIHADGLTRSIDTVIDAAFDAQLEVYGSDMTIVEQETMRREAREQIHQMIDPVLDKIEAKWLKLSPDDFDSSEDAKCMTKVYEEIRADKKQRDELMKIYQRNAFLRVKDTIGSKDGMTGYEIDITSNEVKDAYKNFVAEIRKTAIAQKFEKCGETIDETDGIFERSNTSGTTEPKLVIWANTLTHKMAAMQLDVKHTDGSEAVTMTMRMDFQLGVSDTVAIPQDARSAKEVVEELQNMTGDTLPLSNTRYEYDESASA